MKSMIPSGFSSSGVAMTSSKKVVISKGETSGKALFGSGHDVRDWKSNSSVGSISEEMKNDFALFKLRQHAKSVVAQYEDDTGTVVSVDYDSKTTLSELVVFMREVEVTLGVDFGL